MFEFRNPHWANKDRTALDVEINNETYGWIPYTVEKDSDFYNEVLKGEIADYEAPSVILTDSDYTSAIQNLLDDKAAEKSYSSIETAISYRGDSNTTFAKEAEALFEWRSTVWSFGLNKIEENKKNDVHPTIEEFLSNFPTFTWPE